MSRHDSDGARGLARRTVLRGLGTGLTLVPLAHLLACGEEGSEQALGGDSSESDTDVGDGMDGPDSADSTHPPNGGPGCADDASTWAVGGTAAMTAKHCYPDPFADADTDECALPCWTTEGPCTADSIERQDISEEFTGLPVRLALQIVRADDCEPVAGARVEIWHTQRSGAYSGDTPNNEYCHGGDGQAGEHRCFRGWQWTDEQGRVDFDTCYPGWYPGRAIHIHFRVYLDESTFVISQLFFAEGLTAKIFATHPEYIEFGQPDTRNHDDGIVDGEDELRPYLLDVQRMPDGALLASKRIAIWPPWAGELCEVGE